MASVKELTSMARTEAIQTYLRVSKGREAQQAANPALTSMMQERDPNTGKVGIAFNNGGSFQAQKITDNGGIPVGAVLPATLRNGAGVYIDAKPTG